ncbi:MAG: hypothetical protein GX639_01350 [Fibrobacter sp.]|nr:hypothetical protein [Fibrobacter sp.]
MRYINYDHKKIKLPKNWKQDVKNIEEQLNAEQNPSKRAKLIDENDHLWTNIKPELAKVFNHKCWYTESPQNGTDTDVDHFRPKKRIAELTKKSKKHYGYWWLAFKLENYRYSCIFANRRRRDVETEKVGGKADHFPIFDEKKRALTPTCDFSEEQPILLDPCNPADVALLTFNTYGEAMPRFKSDKATIRQFQRADVSITYYNLNHSDFKRARLDLRDAVDKKLLQAKDYYKKLETGDSTHERSFRDAIIDLRKMCNINSPYSSFCIAYLQTIDSEFYRTYLML